MTETTQKVYQHLLQTQTVQGLMIYGSPYVLEWFRSLMPSELPWVFSYGQLPAAQELALKTLFELKSDKVFNFGF